MRQPGEVHEALLKAAAELTTPNRAPTMVELAAKACVGIDAARRTVDNMKRKGVLVVPRTREVGYRNRPVAEYAIAPPPPPAPLPPPPASAPHVEVARALSLWVQR